MFSRTICVINGMTSAFAFDSGHTVIGVLTAVLSGWFVVRGESIWQ